MFDNLCTRKGEIDWDLVTVCLDRTFQKRWVYSKTEIVASYSDEQEVNSILDKYKSKLYTLAVSLDAEDKLIRDRILTRLVRTAQQGNELARKQVVEQTNFMIYDWMENSKHMARWRGNESEMKKQIETCVRNYQYSGSFTTYLFLTFYYAARGLRQTQSLDTPFGKGKKRRIDFVAMEEVAESDCLSIWE
ncbi:MAG: hypothetical protein ACT4ON_08740 [Bacteroidota bacterium]